MLRKKKKQGWNGLVDSAWKAAKALSSTSQTFGSRARIYHQCFIQCFSKAPWICISLFFSAHTVVSILHVYSCVFTSTKRKIKRYISICRCIRLLVAEVQIYESPRPSVDRYARRFSFNYPSHESKHWKFNEKAMHYRDIFSNWPWHFDPRYA